MRSLFLLGYLLLSTGCLFVSSIASENIDDNGGFDAHFAKLHPSGWHMLEDMFITKPQAKVDESHGKRVLMLMAAATSGVASFGLTEKVLNSINPSDIVGARAYNYLGRKQHHITLGTGIAGGSLTYAWLRSHLIAAEEKKQLANLMEHWQSAKEFLPQKVVDGLEKLAQQYHQKGPQYSQNCDEAIRLIKNVIYEHFPRNYSKRKWADFFSEKRFNIYMNIEFIDMIEKAYGFLKGLLI